MTAINEKRVVAQWVFLYLIHTHLAYVNVDTVIPSSPQTPGCSIGCLHFGVPHAGLVDNHWAGIIDQFYPCPMSKPPGAKNLITQMLTFDPSIRPTAEVGWVRMGQIERFIISFPMKSHPFWWVPEMGVTPKSSHSLLQTILVNLWFWGPQLLRTPIFWCYSPLSDGVDESMVEVQGGVLRLKRGGTKLTRGFSAWSNPYAWKLRTIYLLPSTIKCWLMFGMVIGSHLKP